MSQSVSTNNAVSTRFYGRQQVISAGLVGGPLAGAFMMLVNIRRTGHLNQWPRVAAWFLLLVSLHLGFGVVMQMMPGAGLWLIPYVISVVCTIIFGVHRLQAADIAALEKSPTHKRYSDVRCVVVVLLSLLLSVFMYALFADLVVLVFCPSSCA